MTDQIEPDPPLEWYWPLTYEAAMRMLRSVIFGPGTEVPE